MSAIMVIEIKFLDLNPDEVFAAYDATEEIEKAVKKSIKKTSLSDFFDSISFEVI